MDRDILLEIDGGVATITLNRPEKRNSFTDEMVGRWVAWLDECKARADVNVIVITGAGGVFSAGGDTGGLGEKAEQTPLEARQRIVENTQSLARKLAEIDKPVIAAVDGAAVGGGMDVALMCDVRLASNTARFAETYVKVGLVPGVGGAYFLPRIVGAARALDLFWTGRWVEAEEALSIGLVERVYPADEFAVSVRRYTEGIANAAPLSVRFLKRLVRQSLTMDLDTHLDALSSHIALVRTSSDHKEAMAALKEKRAPKFTGS
jgi:enoyl-CoA hydratase/carnithine racemase